MKSILDSRGRDRVATENLEPSMTIQSQADEADIGKILQKYEQVGVLNLNKAEATFMDVSEMGDFADVARQSKVAEMEFMKLPSKIREIFEHDVANWLDAAHDPDKREKLYEAGFLERPEEPEKVEVPEVAVVPVVEEAGTD